MPSDNFTVLLSFVRKAKIHYLILTKRKNSHYTAFWQWLCIVVGVPGLLLEDFSSEKDLRGERDGPGNERACQACWDNWNQILKSEGGRKLPQQCVITGMFVCEYPKHTYTHKE